MTIKPILILKESDFTHFHLPVHSKTQSDKVARAFEKLIYPQHHRASTIFNMGHEIISIYLPFVLNQNYLECLLPKSSDQSSQFELVTVVSGKPTHFRFCSVRKKSIRKKIPKHGFVCPKIDLTL